MTRFLTVEVCTSVVEYSDNGTVIVSDKYSNIPLEVLELSGDNIEILRAACTTITKDRCYLNGGYTSSRYLCTIKYRDCTVTCSTRDIVPEHIKIIKDMTVQLL